MATIPSTIEEFNADVAKFMEVMGVKTNSQEKVKAAHKRVTLRYLGLKDVTDEQANTAAMHLEVATQGAIARGWDL